MKEKQKDHKKVHEAVSDEEQLIKELANPKSTKPVPQPKDFEEIEY